MMQIGINPRDDLRLIASDNPIIRDLLEEFPNRRALTASELNSIIIRAANFIPATH